MTITISSTQHGREVDSSSLEQIAPGSRPNEFQMANPHFRLEHRENLGKAQDGELDLRDAEGCDVMRVYYFSIVHTRVFTLSCAPLIFTCHLPHSRWLKILGAV